MTNVFPEEAADTGVGAFEVEGVREDAEAVPKEECWKAAEPTGPPKRDCIEVDGVEGYAMSLSVARQGGQADECELQSQYRPVAMSLSHGIRGCGDDERRGGQEWKRRVGSYRGCCWIYQVANWANRRAYAMEVAGSGW